MSDIVESGDKIKVESLNPRSRQVNITVKAVSKNPIRETVSRTDGSAHKVTEELVGDETGTVLLTLWDADIEKVNDGDVKNIGNGYVSLFKGSMRLNIGRFGTMDSSDAVIEVKTDNNLSDKQYEEERRYPSSSRGYSSGRGGYSDRGESGGGYGDRRGGRSDYRRR